MAVTNQTSEQAALATLGQRIAKHRLNANLSQDDLAGEAGVSKRTIIRAERGESVQVANLVRILRVLRLLENMDALIPEPPASPIQQVKMRGKLRRRASKKSNMADHKKPWSWDESQ